MGWRQTALFYVIAALLGAWYFGGSWLERVRPTESPAGRVALLGTAVRAVDEMRLSQGDRRIVARQTAGHWVVREPEGAEVPADLLAALVEALAAAEVIERVADTDAQGAAFGLDERAVRIELLGAGVTPVAILLGSVNPGGTAVYAERVGTVGVVLIGRNVAYYEELVLEALGRREGPAVEQTAPVGG